MENLTNFFNLNREIISPLNQFEIRDLLSLDAPTELSGKQNTMWVKLSNSGDTLEPLVPSYIWKGICGSTNHWCTVISQGASERNVGYRGSKSAILNNIAVKEQRVDGSWHGTEGRGFSERKILNGLLINHRVRTSTKVNDLTNKLLHGRLYTHKPDRGLTENFIINPWFVTGFSDAEACFTLSIIKSKDRKVGWRVFHTFQICLHKKDVALLVQIKNYFLGVGSITKHRSDSISYRVSSVENLLVIFNHFDKYPLITNKWADYQLFKQALILIQNREHTTIEGLNKIVAIKAAMNLGLSDELKAVFTDITLVPRPNILDCKIKDPNWLAGFANGEGCFYVKISPSSSCKTGKVVQLSFQVTQHNKDELLMRSLIEYFNSGNIFKNGDCFVFKVSKFSELDKKIIPFFKDYPILGAKYLDFHNWLLVFYLMKNKAHLTEEGLEQIQLIKSGMNTGRK